MGMGSEILHAHAEPEHDIEVLHRGVTERGLQVAPVDDPVWGAVTLRRFRTERDPHDFPAAASAEQPDSHRRDDMRRQTIGEPKPNQDTRGIRR